MEGDFYGQGCLLGEDREEEKTENQILCAIRLDAFYVTVSSEMNFHLEGKLFKTQNILKGGEMSYTAGNLLNSGGKQPSGFQKPLKVTWFISCLLLQAFLTSKELYKALSAHRSA